LQYFVAGISAATLSRHAGYYARQCRAKTGCFRAFSGILSLFCLNLERFSKATLLRKFQISVAMVAHKIPKVPMK